jgi:cobalamin biosynthesis protein CbiD
MSDRSQRPDADSGDEPLPRRRRTTGTAAAAAAAAGMCSRGSMQHWRRISAVLLMEEPTTVWVKKPRISAVLVATLP